MTATTPPAATDVDFAETAADAYRALHDPDTGRLDHTESDQS